jgi:hypothetical protein
MKTNSKSIYTVAVIILLSMSVVFGISTSSGTWVEVLLVDDFTSALDADVQLVLDEDLTINTQPITIKASSSSSINILSLIDVHLLGGQRDMSCTISQALSGTIVETMAITTSEGWVVHFLPSSNDGDDVIQLSSTLKYDGPAATGLAVNIAGFLGISGLFSAGVDVTSSNQNNALKIDFSIITTTISGSGSGSGSTTSRFRSPSI